MPVSVKQRPHALREHRLCLFDFPPRRHAPMIAPLTVGVFPVSCTQLADGHPAPADQLQARYERAPATAI
jgi:hypothetical protein